MSESNNNDVTSALVSEILQEQRRSRRWKNIRFVLWFGLFLFVIYNLFDLLGDKKITSAGGEKYVALLRLDGMIAPDREFSAEKIVPALKEAFEDRKSKGVIIDINSPGGTPVQSSIIHDAIMGLKKQYHKKVIIVGEDMLTSGAYFIAVAGDKIYVNPNSITGSIGVVMSGFGFVDAMKKLGVERRVYSAGTAKDRLDPFLPINPADVQKVDSVMKKVHQNFIDAVQEGRKGKLKAAPEVLFNGDFWSGQEALELGLVDGLGNLTDVMKKEFATSEFKEYGQSTSLFRYLGGQMNSAMDMFFTSYTTPRPSA